ncbi:uncharacterized protein LOC109857943 [Pseudomyrmex gracilis]|uniref:uncharacterized protein LOC109857943 n=1 Tax=Pseudomyrmex gracilis TaxID=219809 RepID=UPI00099549AB|nr:uncharacterized protein LOC109857943 [Pseudomyrmex gracilis]
MRDVVPRLFILDTKAFPAKKMICLISIHPSPYLNVSHSPNLHRFIRRLFVLLHIVSNFLFQITIRVVTCLCVVALHLPSKQRNVCNRVLHWVVVVVVVSWRTSAATQQTTYPHYASIFIFDSRISSQTTRFVQLKNRILSSSSSSSSSSSII